MDDAFRAWIEETEDQKNGLGEIDADLEDCWEMLEMGITDFDILCLPDNSE